MKQDVTVEKSVWNDNSASHLAETKKRFGNITMRNC